MACYFDSRDVSYKRDGRPLSLQSSESQLPSRELFPTCHRYNSIMAGFLYIYWWCKHPLSLVEPKEVGWKDSGVT